MALQMAEVNIKWILSEYLSRSIVDKSGGQLRASGPEQAEDIRLHSSGFLLAFTL